MRRETAGVEPVVDRRVVARPAGAGRKAQHVSAGAVGPLVKREVFPQVDLRPRILERAQHLFDRRLDQMSFGGEEGVVALVLG